MDWHWLSETSNVLSIVGILVSAFGVAVSVLYASSAKRTAKDALQAANAAKREILIRIAAEEFEGCIEQLTSIRQFVSNGEITNALEITIDLAGSLAEAKTSWPELTEDLDLDEIPVALRETERIPGLLRDNDLENDARTVQVLQRIEIIGRLLRQIRGKLRFRS